MSYFSSLRGSSRLGLEFTGFHGAGWFSSGCVLQVQKVYVCMYVYMHNERIESECSAPNIILTSGHSEEPHQPKTSQKQKPFHRATALKHTPDSETPGSRKSKAYVPTLNPEP